MVRARLGSPNAGTDTTYVIHEARSLRSAVRRVQRLATDTLRLVLVTQRNACSTVRSRYVPRQRPPTAAPHGVAVIGPAGLWTTLARLSWIELVPGEAAEIVVAVPEP